MDYPSILEQLKDLNLEQSKIQYIEQTSRDFTINLTLTKTGAGGWLISNDMDLDNYAKYSEGETVINNILKEYDEEISRRPKAFEGSTFDPNSVLNKDKTSATNNSQTTETTKVGS